MTEPDAPAGADSADPGPAAGGALTPERFILLGFVLGICLAVAVALASFLAISRLQADGRWVAQTQEVIAALESVLATATAAETAALDYAITGDPNLLGAYDGAARDIAGDLARVRRLVKLPAQAQRAGVLAALVEGHLARLSNLLATRRRAGLAGAADFIAGQDYARFHDRVRPYLTEMEGAQRELLKERLARSETSARFALMAVALGSLLSVGLAGLGLYSIRRRFADSRRTQESLLSTNALLDRRVAERTAELHASRELLEQVIDSAPSAIFAMDRSHHYTSTNAAHVVNCGKPADLVLGKTEHDVFPPETAERLWAENEEVMKQGLSRQFERELRRADGSTMSLITIKFPLRDAHGEVAGLGGVSTDITARIQAEEAIRTLNAELEQRVTERTAEAVAANAAKSQFLAHMSHEIRTPLNAMLGLTQVLEGDLVAPEPRQLLQSIRAAGRSLLRIINDILDLSKIEAGLIQLETQPFALQPILDHVAGLMGEMAHLKGLAFRIETPTGLADRLLGDRLLGDPLRLQQVLFNLVDNAVKFTERGSVQVRIMHEDLTATGVRLCVEIDDTGIGIAPEHLAILGTPFTQADSTITRRFGGTGLGLAISKHLVELMGGTFACTSTPGRGSRFRFELPCARASSAPLPVPAVPPADPAGPRLRGMRLLVVEDNDLNRDLLKRALTREGAQVTLVADGRQALDYLSAAPDGCTAVLMDIQMPVMDGLTATRAIRGELGRRDLPVIALTAGVLVEQRQAALAVGVNDFLTKPVDLDELIAVLARCGAPGAPADPAATSAPVAPATMQPALDFPEIPGLDTRQTAVLLGHDRAFFLELLARFATAFGGSAQAVRDDLARGQGPAAARQLHALRGIAGHIGARDLVKTVAALEQAIAAGADAVEVLLGQFDAQLRTLLAALEPWLEPTAQEAAEHHDAAALAPAGHAALCAALARRDLAARALFRDLRPALVRHYGAAATQAMGEAIQTLRFADALARLEQGP